MSNTKTVTFNGTTLNDVNSSASHVMLIKPTQQEDESNEQDDSTEEIFELADNNKLEVTTLNTGLQWYALVFFYMEKGEVIYTDLFVKKQPGDKPEKVEIDEYQHIFEYLNNNPESNSTKEDENKQINDQVINEITPITYPKTNYANEFVRVKKILNTIYNKLLEKIKDLTKEGEPEETRNIQAEFNKKKQLADEVEQCSMEFLIILHELRDKNEKNMKQLEKLQSTEKTKQKPRIFVTKFMFDKEVVAKPFYYPPFDLQTNNEFLQQISEYEQKITTIMNKLKGFELTKDFTKTSQQKTTILLSEIAKLHSDYSDHVVKLLQATDGIDQALKTFNEQAENTRKSVDTLVSKFSKDQSMYSDLDKINHAINNFYEYINSTTIELHEKFKHNISELKLQNRQGNFLSLIPLENMSIKPNDTVELTNPQYMNYYSMINLIYSIHHMNEYLKNSMHFNRNIALNQKERVPYEMVPFADKFQAIDRLRQPATNERDMLDLHVDIGYNNYLYAVEEFMHLFNKLRYHPLIYKFNGLKKEQFNAIFTNTDDFRYISEIDMETMNADFDDETEFDNEPETDYHTYSNREKKDDFEGATPFSYKDNLDFFHHLTLESKRRQKNKLTKLIKGLDADFQKLKEEKNMIVEQEKKLQTFKLQIQDYNNENAELETQYAQKRADLIKKQSEQLIQNYENYIQSLSTKLTEYQTKLTAQNTAVDGEKTEYIKGAIKATEYLMKEANVRRDAFTSSKQTEETIQEGKKELDRIKTQEPNEVYNEFNNNTKYKDTIEDIIQREIKALFEKNITLTGGKQTGGNIKEFSNYNLKRIKKMYLDTVFPKADMFRNFVNDLYTSRTEEHSEKFILLLKNITSDEECVDNGKIYFDRYYNLDPTISRTKELENKRNNKKRINLFHFMSVIFANYTDYFKQNRGSYIRTRFFSSLMRSFSKRFKVFQKVIHLFENQEPKFIRRIDHFIDLANKENILTYIKLRSDDPNHYNARFDIYFNRITENKLGEENNLHGSTNNIRFVYPNQDYYDSLLIRYNDDDHKYYTNLSDRKSKANVDSIFSSDTKLTDYEISPEIEESRLQKTQKVNTLTVQDEILYAIKKKMNLFPNQMFYQHKTTKNIIFPRYDHNYMLGKFTKIFQPQMSNGEIAKYMNHVVDQLLLHNPVFILGYGASGAGKTSTLIYFNKGDSDKKEGIVIHIANILAAKGYHSVELCAEEFYDTQTYTLSGDLIPRSDKPTTIKVPANDARIHFKYNNEGGFLLEDSSYNHTNVHLYRNENKESTNGTDDSENFDKTTPFKTGDPMGQIMIHLVDTDRLVKATTNNVNSSRSHTLVYLTFIKKYDTKNYSGTNRVEILKNKVLEEDRLQLIIGDFAGVENKFTCGEPSTIQQFHDIKIKNPNNDGTDVGFYAQYAKPIQGVYDNGGGGQIGGQPKEMELTEKGFNENGFDPDKISGYIKELMNPVNFKGNFNTLIKDLCYEGSSNTMKRYFKSINVDTVESFLKNNESSKGASDLFKEIGTFLEINKYDDVSSTVNAYQAHLSHMIPTIPPSENESLTVSDELFKGDSNKLYTDLVKSNVNLPEPKFINKIIKDKEKMDADQQQNNAEKQRIEQELITRKTIIEKEITSISQLITEKSGKRNEAESLKEKQSKQQQQNVIKNELLEKTIESLKIKEEISMALETDIIRKTNEKNAEEAGIRQANKLAQDKYIAKETEAKKVVNEANFQTLNAECIKPKDSENIEQIERDLSAAKLEKQKIEDDLKDIPTKYNNIRNQFIKEPDELSAKTTIEHARSKLFELIDPIIQIIIKNDLQSEYNKMTDDFDEKKTKIVQNKPVNYFPIKTTLKTKQGIYNDNIKKIVDINYFNEKTILQMRDCIEAIQKIGNLKRSDFKGFYRSLGYTTTNGTETDEYWGKQFNTMISEANGYVSTIENANVAADKRSNEIKNIRTQNKTKLNEFEIITFDQTFDFSYEAILKKITDLENAEKKELLSNVNERISTLTKKQNWIKIVENNKQVFNVSLSALNTSTDTKKDIDYTNVNSLKEKLEEPLTNYMRSIKPELKVIDAKIGVELADLNSQQKSLKSSIESLTQTKNNTKITPVDPKDYASILENINNNLKLLQNRKNKLSERINKLIAILNGQFAKNYTLHKEESNDVINGLTTYSGNISEEVLIPEFNDDDSAVDLPDTGHLNTFMEQKLKYTFIQPDYSKEYTEIQYFLIKFIDLLLKAKFQYKYMQQICSNRLREGIFINQSLRDMRITLKDMIAAKSGDHIDTIPNFIETCMKSYCTKYENCFETNEKRIPDFSKIDSVLIRSIFDKLRGNSSPGNGTPEQIKEFYKNLQVCAFCVVNITIDNTANNPPPSPYIDINKLKTLFYSHKNTIFGNPTKLKFEFKQTPILPNAEPNNYEQSSNQTNHIKIRESFLEECKSVINIIDNKYNKGGRADFIATLQKDIIFTQFKKIIDEISNNLMEGKRDQNVEKVRDGSETININKIPMFVNAIENFIEFMNNVNATSTIGTLEFMDFFSKYNQTKMLCTVPTGDSPSQYNMIDIKNAILLQKEAFKNEASY